MSLRPRNIHFPCVFIVCCVFFLSLFIFWDQMVIRPLKGKEYTTLGDPVTSSQASEGEEHESMNQT